MGNNSSKSSSHGGDGLQSYPSFSRVDTQGSTRSARSSRSVKSKLSTSSTNASAGSPPSVGSPRLTGTNDDPEPVSDASTTLSGPTGGIPNNDLQQGSADLGSDSALDSHHHHHHHHQHHQSSRGFIRGTSPLGQRLHRRTNSSSFMGNSSQSSPHHSGSRSASPGSVFYPPPSMQTVEPKEPILIRRGAGPLSIDAQKSEGFSPDGQASQTSPASGQSASQDPPHGQSVSSTDPTTSIGSPILQNAVRQSSYSSGIRSPHPSQVISSDSPVPSDNSPGFGNSSSNPPSPGPDHKSFLSRSKATYVAKQSPPSSLTSLSRSSNELTLGSSSLDVDEIIQRLLDAGYSGKVTKSVCLKNAEINIICATARNIFLSQPALLELAPSVKVVGDVHGQYGDLLRLFDKCGFPPRANYLFLGDYVDRGKQSLETILLLLCYKIKYPENFFLLRGNHECANVTRVYGFYDECKRRASIKTWKTFIDTFNTLPIAAVVASKIFCVHGGLSPSLNAMDDIRNIIRPTDVPDYGLLNDLLWSDPADTINEWEDNERGVSYCFGKIAINKFLAKFGFDLICRAHMVVEDGYEFFNERSLVTVFSAPNYCGEFDNWGAVMGVSEELLCSFELIKPLDSVSLKQEMKKGRYERKNGLNSSPSPSQVPQSY